MSDQKSLALAVGAGVLAGVGLATAYCHMACRGASSSGSACSKKKSSCCAPKEETPSEVKIGYWKIRGLAQPLRYACELTGVPYDDSRYECGPAPEYSREEWLSVKHTLGLAFPNLPYVIDESSGAKITQSNAVLRYILRLTAKGRAMLGGDSAVDQSVVDMYIDQAYDLRNAVVGCAYGPKDTYDDRLKTLETKARSMLAAIEADSSEGKWQLDFFSAADVLLYEMMYQLRHMIPGILDAYPKLKAQHDAFADLAEIKAFHAGPKAFDKPFNNKMAAFTGN